MAEARRLLASLFAVATLASTEAALAQQTQQQTPPKPKPASTDSPGTDADPPPIPPPAGTTAPPPAPTSGGPMSTSGTLLLPPQTSSAAPAGTPSAPVTAPVDVAHESDQDARAAKLADRLDAAEKKLAAMDQQLGFLKHLLIKGYVQPQLLIQSFNDAASPNAVNGVLPAGVSANAVLAKSDGTTTNGTFFRMRRARLWLGFTPQENMRVIFEIDPNLSGGPAGGTGTIARNIEAAGIVNYTPSISQDFAVGIFKIPFDSEIIQSDAERPFIERSWGEQNMFPAEFDTGAKSKITFSNLNLFADVAVVNGVTIGEKAFAIVPDLNRGKDVLGRVNWNLGMFEVGTGGYYGSGQNVDAANLKFKQFNRWAWNVEGAVHHTFVPKLGQTKLLAEFVLAQNMDRGTKYSFAVPQIPSNINLDAQCGGALNTACDERSIWVRLEQDITKWATAGIRWDQYSPDTAQGSNARDTFSFVGVAHFTKGLQFMAEYDYAEDSVHKPLTPIPAKKIHVGSGVLQGRF